MTRLFYRSAILLIVLLLILPDTFGQRRRRKQQPEPQPSFAADALKGLEFRGIGPAFMSGRIADIAIHPEDDNVWYVAVGSGGVWKTTNAGITWTPIFDDQNSYSIGCVAIDPRNPHTVWVGTGENVGGRHIGYGDGIYKSEDGGETWNNMGLPNSEHISKIVVHPDNSNVIWVAAQGPLWSKGGERGFYKSTDGGQTWERTLGNDEWTGVTDIIVDPRNPMRLYAATWDRHRTVAAYMGGGPGTGIHRSEDGGETWTELKTGLPSSNMGKIGLAISTQNPDIVYAAIELDRRTGGVYRSTDRGASWEKRSEAVAGATGPHYYQELYASPHHFDRLYLVDNHMQYSVDGGKTFHRLNNKHKHGDNHAIAFRQDDPDYLLVGTDGGVYESFDLGKHWRFMANLPVTQYYKVAVDDAEPFYNIFGGTQDNNTQGGPSRTDNLHGISNSDWRVVLDWDGHQPATEPGNPDIMYAERQEGHLSRIDMITGETIDIQPQAGPGEPAERFNWDAPILVSPHSPTRIYFASQRVWKSENRGDAWTAISDDLTRNQNRIELSIMGRQQSWDNPWDFLAMSNYNTITSLAESPVQEGLLYAGTDDGLIQVSENGGESWREIEVGSILGVPATAFVNDIKADLFDANTVYVVLDNHKYGDYAPYLVKSTDRGQSWQSLRANLPDRTLLWRIVQDHEEAGLMFLATEYGIYTTVNGGEEWLKIEGGLPTISFRDLAIQRRENDLVAASFGRGFYVLDDYSILREVSAEQMNQEATLFGTRKAWWYIPRPVYSFDDEKGSQGASYYMAPNPPFGAVFTYHLKDSLPTLKDQRKAQEKSLEGQDIPFGGYEAMTAEATQPAPKIWLTVRDQEGNVIRRLSGPTGKGFHRVAWDLRYPAPQALREMAKPDPGEEEPTGMLAVPGTYTVSLDKEVEGAVTPLAEPREFEVVPLREGALPGASPEEASAFWRTYEDLSGAISNLHHEFEESERELGALKTALHRTPAAPGVLDSMWHTLHQSTLALDISLHGDPSRNQVGEKNPATIGERLSALSRGLSNSTYGPTETHKQTVEIIENELEELEQAMSALDDGLDELAEQIQEAGGPEVD